jgi:hypothetical protein
MTDGGTGTEVMLEFNYDRLYIEPNLPINSGNYQGNITRASEGGNYQITFENLPASSGTNQNLRESYGVRNDSDDIGLEEIQVTTKRRETTLNSVNSAYTEQQQQSFKEELDQVASDTQTTIQNNISNQRTFP